MEITISEILRLTKGKYLKGPQDKIFSGIASLKDAKSEDVSFLGNEKYFKDYNETKAGLVLIAKGIEQVKGDVVLIEVENPSFAFGEIVNALTAQESSFSAGIHLSAIVSEDAQFDRKKVCIKAGAVIESGVTIGDGSEIGAGAVLCEGVTIGKDCLIYPNVTVREKCVVGNRVILQPGCVIGSDGFGFELVDGKHVKVAQVGIVLIEDDVEIGANATIDRARFGKTTIGMGSKIDNLVQIAHNVIIGNHCLLVSQSGIAGSSELGNYVTVAAQAGVAGHLHIGDKALLMARTGVVKSLEGDEYYKGFPARPVKEEQKKAAALARVPRLIKQVKELQVELDLLRDKKSH